MTRFPIQLAKIQRPPLPEGILRRDRLLNWLDAKVHNRVVLVTAEAGYGKTTTLADWSRATGTRTAWFRFDDDDRDWATFTHHLVAALRQINPSFGAGVVSSLETLGTSASTRERVLAALLAELPIVLEGKRIALIFDDFHAAEDAHDVRLFLRDLIGRLPDGLSVVISSRRTPRLSLAKLRSLGEVAELVTDDLRFDLLETERLFREAYRTPLERDVLGELSRRTDGWAASLQLVQAALRGRTSSEMRSFVRNLSSSQEALYDYLAEEVVGDLAEDLQQFLMRTSILQTIDPETAGLVVGIADADATTMIRRAQAIGLLPYRGRTAGQYHPLVRDFLLTRLGRDEGEGRVLMLHRRVAERVEGRNWRGAAHHYAASGDSEAVQRVISGAAPEILGTGDFALAESYIEQISIADRTPPLTVIASRLALSQGRLIEALDLARTAFEHARVAASSFDFALATTNLMNLEFVAGNVDRSLDLANSLAAEDSGELSELARAFIAVNQATLDKNLDEFVHELMALAQKHQALGQDRDYGITNLNLAFAERSRGRPESVLVAADEAIDALSRTGSVLEVPSARCIRAWALMHLCRSEEAEAELGRALNASTQLTQIEAYREAGEVVGMFGDPVRAQGLLQEAIRLGEADPSSPPSGPEIEIAYLSLAQNCIRLGRFDAAAQYLNHTSGDRYTTENAHSARVLTVAAELAVAEGRGDAGQLAHRAAEHSGRQGARMYAEMAEVMLATLQPDSQMSLRISSIGRRDRTYLTMEAAAVVRRLGDLDEASLSLVAAESAQHPAVWRHHLRGCIQTAIGRARVRAAHLLATIGDLSDVKLLRNGARASRKVTELDEAARGLARSLARPVFVDDLGRVVIHFGGDELPAVAVRKKSLALLCYLLTTPSMSASRDQVVDALWPDGEPGSALNSLNQTVYFLRRTLEPGYDEDTSPGYLLHDGDVIWLNPELVSSRSRRCRELLAALETNLDLSMVRRLVEDYRAPFALDFMYEEWAAPFRSTLHSAFLEVVENALTLGLEAGQYAEAIAVARRTLAVDAEADQIELSLLRLLQKSGAPAAAAEQYGHYASFSAGLGVEVPRLDDLVAGGDTEATVRNPPYDRPGRDLVLGYRRRTGWRTQRYGS